MKLCSLTRSKHGPYAHPVSQTQLYPVISPTSTLLCPVSDYYQLDDLLTPEEKAVRIQIREAAEKHIAPIIAKVSGIP
jgi:acyl-CoA oxidase